MHNQIRNFFFILVALISIETLAADRHLAYLVSDLRIPYWNIMWKGVEHQAGKLGYRVKVYSAENDTKTELQNTIRAIKDQVEGIVLSPMNSSTAVTILEIAKKAEVPVVIADIGTQGGDFVSYIESDNHRGAYRLGKILVQSLQAREWDNASVGIVAIPQRRKNGKLRTQGFISALDESGIPIADIRQQVDFSYEETYRFASELIQQHQSLRALWLQGSDRYQAALDAIRDTEKQGEVLLICFDAEPEFIAMIRDGSLIGAGMQQPFMMGEKAVESLHKYLSGYPVPRQQKLEVLVVSANTIEDQLPFIKRNVLGQLPK